MEDICNSCRYKDGSRCTRFVGFSIGGKDWFGSDYKDRANNQCQYFETGESVAYQPMPIWNS